MPYALLLSRDLKRNTGKLRVIATWILFARLADYYWHVAPELHKGGLSISLLDVALPLALGGIFITLFVSQLGGRSLLPVNDPDLERRCITMSTEHVSEHDLEYGPTPPGAKHEHTDIDPSTSATSSRRGWRWRC